MIKEEFLIVKPRAIHKSPSLPKHVLRVPIAGTLVERLG